MGDPSPLCRVCWGEKDEWCGRCLNAPVHEPHQEYLFRPTEDGCISYHEYEPSLGQSEEVKP